MSHDCPAPPEVAVDIGTPWDDDDDGSGSGLGELVMKRKKREDQTMNKMVEETRKKRAAEPPLPDDIWISESKNQKGDMAGDHEVV